MLSRKWCLLAAFAVASPALADVKPHPLFSDHMVLQRDTELKVWGKADPGEKVTVTLGEATASADADKDGNWAVKLPAQKAGAGHTLTIKGNNTVTLNDVAIGDVWLCSGQSNMEWKLSQLNRDDSAKGVTKDQGKEAAAKAENKMIRLFTVPNRPALEPQSTFPVTANEGHWLECKPDTVINFSAVGYFFGRDIQATQNVPVGLISADWGGTVCEAWASKEALDAVPELKYMHEKLADQVKNFDQRRMEQNYQQQMERWKMRAEQARAAGRPVPRQPQKPVPYNQNSPSALFNGMIAPIVGFPIKGAIWYQGESNAGRAAEYYTLFPTMIQDWRKRWGSEFTFLAVQLAPFQNDNSANSEYAEVRDAQFQISKKLKNAGYATIMDVGNETDIHPQAKEPVGKRLALAARAIAYGEKVEWSGPVFKSMKVDGSKAVLSFDHVGKGLASTGEKLNGFQVCGEDKKFVPASAEIAGDTVVVSASNVDKPVAVRYAWSNFPKPEANLANKDGLPAVPFRTDDFTLTTVKK